jgi:hypothetical protein
VTAAPSGPVPQVKGLNCPNCGAALAVRGFEYTRNVVCVQCLSVIDAKDPNLQVLQQFQARERYLPVIPLGSRGKLHGDTYEVIGFQVREIQVDGMPYSWAEYLLFNPYNGFRYLTEYDGHWNDVRSIQALPEMSRTGKKPVAKVFGRRFVHFQSAIATTTCVMGEFPWQVKVDESVRVNDFIDPPCMLSLEITDLESAWSMGEYVTGAEIWKAFGLPGHAPPAKGIYANQPSPYGGEARTIWSLCAWFLAITFFMAAAFAVFAREETVLQHAYTLSRSATGEASFVTEPFSLKGRTSNVEIAIRTNLANSWAYFGFALIDMTTGEALDFGREVSYYTGRDSDGSWTEGSPSDSVKIPSVKPGTYYLRVEPEMAPETSLLSYELTVRRDVPSYSWFLIAGLLLLVPPAFSVLRSGRFELARWQESDYATSSEK